jgi:hypothetical protein
MVPEDEVIMDSTDNSNAPVKTPTKLALTILSSL